MINPNAIESTLSVFGESFVNSIRNELDRQGLTDTGKAKRETVYQVEANETRAILSITAPAYIVSLNSGAKPIRKRLDGTFISSLQAWAQRKLGLDPKEAKGFAFAYLKKRMGDGVGGRTTSPSGAYVVPNPFNEGGVLTKGITDKNITDLKDAIFAELASSYTEVTKRIISQ